MYSLRRAATRSSSSSLRPLLVGRCQHLTNPTTLPAKNPNYYFLRSLSSSSSSSAPDSETLKYIGYFALVLGCGIATYYSFPFPENAKHKKAQFFRYAPLPEDLHSVSNWSDTHQVQTRVFLQPETLEDLEKIVIQSNQNKHKIRPVGSALSPNGIGLNRQGMLNLSLMDNILEVDKGKKTVRVQAGIRVQQLVDGIKDHGLTLQNFASIREQQIGGILQDDGAQNLQLRSILKASISRTIFV